MTEESPSPEALANSMCNLIDNLTAGGTYGAGGAPLSQADPGYYNLRWYLVSNDRNLLSQMYCEMGLIQTLVDQPVDDAFALGFELKSEQLDANDCEEIYKYFEEHKVNQAIGQAFKWCRLYGGGGVLVAVPIGKPDDPLDLTRIKPDTPIAFIATDMWELYQQKLNIPGDLAPFTDADEYYDYYSQRVHKSRVCTIKGKEPPSFVRPRLRGWGMSELEKMVRPINAYYKNGNVVYELLDEAKVDIYRLKGLNASLATPTGSNTVRQRIQMSNLLKNYNHALTMDSTDEYDQKVMNFSGLDAMAQQNHNDVASNMKMPQTKIFGQSAAGFNSGEDDIENYNSTLRSDIQAKSKHLYMTMVKIACQQLFGMIPDDLQISFPPLRILSAEGEEKVKDSQMERLIKAQAAGLISPLDAKKAINADSLIGTEIDETDETFQLEPEEPDAKKEEKKNSIMKRLFRRK